MEEALCQLNGELGSREEAISFVESKFGQKSKEYQASPVEKT